MDSIKKIADKVPAISGLYYTLSNSFMRLALFSKTTEDIFADIYRNNKWRGKYSISGRGSDINQTRIVARELPVLFKEYCITSLLDIPCGDFRWMKNVNLQNMSYTGADIVNDIVIKNRILFGNHNINFIHSNIIKDKLPEADMIFCRDCFIHFSFDDIFSALQNICRSDAEYLLTTTFTERKKNYDIVTGRWRPINLQSTPFNLPPPLKLINEGCTLHNGMYKDKSLGLWRVKDIQKSL